jgi:hypothetical protein
MTTTTAARVSSTRLRSQPPAGRDAPAQVPAAPRRAAMSLQRDWVLADISTELDRFRAYYDAAIPRPGVTS